MKVLVCGGREYQNRDRVIQVLNDLNSRHGVSLLIHGDARGADRLAGNWAESAGVQEVRCPANWLYYGRRAGHRRNASMLLLEPDLVVAFPGGKGTAMMVQLAKDNNIRVIDVADYDNDNASQVRAQTSPKSPGQKKSRRARGRCGLVEEGIPEGTS